MTHHVSSMLETYPKDLGDIDQQKLAECIEACFECVQTCTACEPGLRRHLREHRPCALPSDRQQRRGHPGRPGGMPGRLQGLRRRVRPARG